MIESIKIFSSSNEKKKILEKNKNIVNANEQFKDFPR